MLWWSCVVVVQEGSEMVEVMKEEAVVASVRKHILQGGPGRGVERKDWVHRQGVRVPWAEGG